jgi:type II secretory pathway component HofQ
MKTISVRQMATIKRVAQNVNPLVVKKNKIAAKIEELKAEYEDLNNEIAGHEMGIKALTGGYISEDLVIKKVEDSGKIDKDGKSIKVTKYEPREDILSFDDENNVYIINEPVASQETECENIENTNVEPFNV